MSFERVSEQLDDGIVDSEDENKEDDGNTKLGDMIAHLWQRRKTRLDGDYAKAGWMLCVQKDVYADVEQRPPGVDERLAIERVITKLHSPPCPNESRGVKGKSMAQIIDIFWDEYQAFTDKTAPFDKPGRFLTDDGFAGRSYLWHQKYCLNYNEVFGFVACRVCSKVLG